MIPTSRHGSRSKRSAHFDLRQEDTRQRDQELQNWLLRRSSPLPLSLRVFKRRFNLSAKPSRQAEMSEKRLPRGTTGVFACTSARSIMLAVALLLRHTDERVERVRIHRLFGLVQ